MAGSIGQPEPALSARARTRLGDAGRERAVGVLKRAFAKGQLSGEEFERRVELAYQAQIRHELRPILEDLPEYQSVRANPRMTAFWLD